MPTWAKAAIDAYVKAAKLNEGSIFRAVNRYGAVGKRESMTEQAVYNVVTEYGRALGFKDLSPDDLRNTYESMIREAGEGLYEIKINQESRETAERLLSQETLKDTPCDRLGLKI